MPAVFHAPTDLSARARAEVHVGGLQGSVPGQSSSTHRGHEEAEVPRVTLELWKDGKARLRVHARRTRPLRSTFQAICRRLELQEAQVRLFNGEVLLSPYDLLDQLGLDDGDVIEAEEVEDEDMIEIRMRNTWSRFPARFLPMRVCRWYPAGDCLQGMGVHVCSQCERIPPPPPPSPPFPWWP